MIRTLEQFLAYFNVEDEEALKAHLMDFYEATYRREGDEIYLNNYKLTLPTTSNQIDIVIWTIQRG